MTFVITSSTMLGRAIQQILFFSAYFFIAATGLVLVTIDEDNGVLGGADLALLLVYLADGIGNHCSDFLCCSRFEISGALALSFCSTGCPLLLTYESS